MWTGSASRLSRLSRVSTVNVSAARHAPPRRLLHGRRPSRQFAAKWDGDVEALTKRLEEFTETKEEVLLVKAEVGGEEDEVLVFRGFSSSLMRPTPDNPDMPVLPAGSIITSIDRLQAPYNPAGDQVILAAGLSLDQVMELLEEAGL